MTAERPGAGRRVADLVRLAGPVVVARAGILVMAFVDTVMVGRFSSAELAYLGIGLAPITAILVALVGLLLGTLVTTASAFGAGNLAACGAAWRRSLGFALAAGAIFAAPCLFGEAVLAALGQSPELAAGGGPVSRIVALGVPLQLVFVASTFFLEGIKRPLPGMVLMIAANLVNVALNWVLVYGNLGFPALGAAGSAWATTAVRALLCAAVLGYVWTMADGERFGVRRRPQGGWRAWAGQRRIGYAAGASIGVESTAFAVVSVFAGWLGTLPLAAFSIGLNLIAMAFMVAIGVGSATAVLVGIAHGRGDARETALAGWTGLGVNTAAMVALGAVFALAPATLTGLYTTDAELAAIAAPIVAFCAWVLVADGGQAVMANALRGRGETWVATGLHTVSYFVVMIPVSWALAFPAGRGALGLFEGTLIASVVSVALLAFRFHWLSRRDRDAERLPGRTPPG